MSCNVSYLFELSRRQTRLRNGQTITVYGHIKMQKPARKFPRTVVKAMITTHARKGRGIWHFRRSFEDVASGASRFRVLDSPVRARASWSCAIWFAVVCQRRQSQRSEAPDGGNGIVCPDKNGRYPTGTCDGWVSGLPLAVAFGKSAMDAPSGEGRLLTYDCWPGLVVDGFHVGLCK